MMLPKAVVFDLGKVLVDFDYRIAIQNILARCTVSAETLNALINGSPLLQQYELGQVTTDEFFATVKSATGFRGDLEEFGDLFTSIFTEIPQMVRLNEEVRARGVPTYIFSNTNEVTIRMFRRRFPFFLNFTDYVLSYEHGVMKPDAGLYEQLERVTGRSRAELFYIDDRPENIETARRRGWQAVVHETPKQTRAALSATGLLS